MFAKNKNRIGVFSPPYDVQPRRLCVWSNADTEANSLTNGRIFSKR